MRQAYTIVREQLQVGFERAKRRYDERVKSIKFCEGQFVWHFIPDFERGSTENGCWQTKASTA